MTGAQTIRLPENLKPWIFTTENRLAEVHSAFARSALPEEPDRELVASVLVSIREEM
jgi:hypothetical protein